MESIADRDESARELLEGPEFPDELAYLWEWVLSLHGQSGVGPQGFLPTSQTTVYHWRRNMRVVIEPHEVDALIRISRAYLYPSAEEDD